MDDEKKPADVQDDWDDLPTVFELFGKALCPNGWVGWVKKKRRPRFHAEAHAQERPSPKTARRMSKRPVDWPAPGGKKYLHQYKLWLRKNKVCDALRDWGERGVIKARLVNVDTRIEIVRQADAEMKLERQHWQNRKVFWFNPASGLAGFKNSISWRESGKLEIERAGVEAILAEIQGPQSPAALAAATPTPPSDTAPAAAIQRSQARPSPVVIRNFVDDYIEGERCAGREPTAMHLYDAAEAAEFNATKRALEKALRVRVPVVLGRPKSRREKSAK